MGVQRWGMTKLLQVSPCSEWRSDLHPQCAHQTSRTYATTINKALALKRTGNWLRRAAIVTVQMKVGNMIDLAIFGEAVERIFLRNSGEIMTFGEEVGFLRNWSVVGIFGEEVESVVVVVVASRLVDAKAKWICPVIRPVRHKA